MPRAWVGLQLIRLGARVAGAQEEGDTRVSPPNDDLDEPTAPTPFIVVTPAALRLVAEPGPRKQEAKPPEPLEGSLAAQLRRR